MLWKVWHQKMNHLTQSISTPSERPPEKLDRTWTHILFRYVPGGIVLAVYHGGDTPDEFVEARGAWMLTSGGDA
jgi:hypothetical protein